MASSSPVSSANSTQDLDSRDHIRFAVVCSSNMNRSMEAHRVMAKKGFNVESFGANQVVKIPSSIKNESNCYKFGVSYEAIYQDLVLKNRSFYKKTGLLDMVERNRQVKLSPECFMLTEKRFDVIITCQELVYDKVSNFLEDMDRNLAPDAQDEPVHVINIDILDSFDDAILGAYWICELARMLCTASDLDKEIYKILAEFEEKAEGRNILHSVFYY